MVRLVPIAIRGQDKYGFPPPQAYLTYARSVQVGAQRGVEECKHQFAWDRWNCPDSATQLKGLRRGKDTILLSSSVFRRITVDFFFYLLLRCLRVNSWIFKSISLTATRETSFVHAISSAGVMYTLTRNCSLGELDHCGCDVSRNGKSGEHPTKNLTFI